MSKIYFYDLSYFRTRKDTGSIYVKTNKNVKDYISEDVFLNELVAEGKLHESDANTISDIYQLSEEEYQDMVGYAG